MKTRLLPFTLICLALLAAATPEAFARQAGDGDRVERAIPAEPNVTVFIPKAEGRVTVRGWERAEVLASSAAAKDIELRRVDDLNPGGPARRVRLVISGDQGGNLRVNVPRGASVQIDVDDAVVSVENVAEVRAESRGGNVELRHVTRSSEAKTVSGNVLLQRSSGSVRVKTVSGSVEISEVQPQAPGDDVRVSSVGGSLLLDSVGQGRVEAETTSGSVRVIGPLTREARYDLRTVTGDLSVVLPDEDAFQLDVRTTKKGSFISELPRTIISETNPPGSRHLTGARGAGSATLNLFNYSGAVRLLRKTPGRV